MYGEENIISVIHVDTTTPHLHCDFVPLTKRGNLSAKDVIGRQKENAQDAREISLKQCKKGCLALNLTFNGESNTNGLDQKLYER